MMTRAIAFGMLLTCFLYSKVPLRKVFREAIRINAAVKSQKLEEATWQVQALNSRLKKWFNIDFAGSYRFASDTMEITSESFPFAQADPMSATRVLIQTPAHTFDFKLSLIQPIYTGGMIANAIRADEMRGASEAQITRLRAGEVVIKVKASFFTCLLIQKKSKSLEILLESLKLHQSRQQNLFSEELIKKSDLLETQNRLVETEISLQDIFQLLEREKIQFQSLTGFSFDEIESDYRDEETTLDEALILLRTHPMVQALDERIQQTTFQKKVVAGSSLPQVAGFAEFHFSRPGMNLFKDAWTPYFIGGISVSMSVFNWRKPQRETTLVEVSRKKLENMKEDFLFESEKNLKQLFLQQSSQLTKLGLLKKQVAIAKEEAEIKEKMCSENQIDHISYLMAISQLERVQSQIDELMIQQELTKVNLWGVIGKISEDK